MAKKNESMERGEARPIKPVVEEQAEQPISPTAHVERLLAVKRQELENLKVVRADWEAHESRQNDPIKEYSEVHDQAAAIREQNPAWKEAWEKLMPHADRLQYYGELKDLLSQGEHGAKILDERLDFSEGALQKFQRDGGALRNRLARLLSKEKLAAYQEELSKMQKDAEKYRAMVKDFQDPATLPKIASYMEEVRPLQDRVRELDDAARTEAGKPVAARAAHRKARAGADPTKEMEEKLQAEIKALERQLAELEGN